MSAVLKQDLFKTVFYPAINDRFRGMYSTVIASETKKQNCSPGINGYMVCTTGKRAEPGSVDASYSSKKQNKLSSSYEKIKTIPSKIATPPENRTLN